MNKHPFLLGIAIGFLVLIWGVVVIFAGAIIAATVFK